MADIRSILQLRRMLYTVMFIKTHIQRISAHFKFSIAQLIETSVLGERDPEI